MNLHTPHPYWLMKNGCTMVCDTLDKDAESTVAIIGGGISGSLTAHALAGAGIDCVLLEKRHPACGSTAASTALLQFEIDKALHELAELYGFAHAAEAYRSCVEAIDAIETTCRDQGIDADFRRLPSLQYASRPEDAALLRREAKFRQKAGLESEYLETGEIQRRFGFSAPAGLLSPQAAEVDAYRLAQGLLQSMTAKIQVFDNVLVESITPGPAGVRLHTACGHTVKAEHVVVAAGYESCRFLDRDWYRRTSTYALVSKPMESGLPSCLIWETASPYIYVRTTGDGRIIAGGRDDDFADPLRRDAALPSKVSGLLDDLKICLPDLTPVPDFTWAGTFGETKDSLAYIGNLPGENRVHYLMGFGGNGVVFSLTGAQIIRDAILGRPNRYAPVFRFDR